MASVSPLAADAENHRQAITAMSAAFLTRGLTVSMQKSKALVIGKIAEVHASHLRVVTHAVELGTVSA